MSRPGSPDDELSQWVADTVQRALAYAVTLIRNKADAEDIVHDCYRRLLSRADQYNLPDDGSKLLFKSITNACINWTRRRPPFVSLDVAEHGIGPDKSDAEPEQRAIHGELEAAVTEALTELPVTQRAIVELRSLGHSLLEIAEMLEMSHANARVQLHRARQALATRLRPFIEDHVT
ncbi:RNA polymerase sigma factor (plasmid) [Singulisphaera sp. Ch08]|uniref:RNA polymerase sigma factor n=1 Tax=Singulisphaera sp. Ch08 TaxID=3120278 RepID=A0AAU7CSA5_9BACT